MNTLYAIIQGPAEELPRRTHLIGTRISQGVVPGLTLYDHFGNWYCLSAYNYGLHTLRQGYPDQDRILDYNDPKFIEQLVNRLRKLQKM